jgi:hypothetical protein
VTYKVICKYVPLTGSADAPGEHYTLQAAEPERRVSATAYRHYSFYRTPKGSEVAADIGYSGDGTYWPLAKDGDIFRALKETVEQYDRENS